MFTVYGFGLSEPAKMCYEQLPLHDHPAKTRSFPNLVVTGSGRWVGDVFSRSLCEYVGPLGRKPPKP